MTRKIVFGLLFGLLLLLVSLPMIVRAEPNDTITVTATGSGSHIITDFQVDVVDYDFNEDVGQWISTVGSWTIPETVDGVVIVRSFTAYPTDLTDGVLVYEGNGTTFSETVTGEDVSSIYYTAWTYTGESYSAPIYYLLETEMRVLIEPSWIYMLMSVGLIILSYKVLVSYACRILAGFATIATGIYQVMEAENEWTYTIIGVIFMAFGLYILIMVAYEYISEERYG